MEVFMFLFILSLPYPMVANREEQVCQIEDKVADCFNRQLSEVPQNLPANIIHLNLRSNVLTLLEGGQFDRYVHLLELDLRFNNISRILPGAFQSLIFLEKLWLYHNPLSYCSENLPVDALKGLNSLRELSILPILPKNGGFMGIPFKQLCMGSPNIFRFVPKLEYLSIGIPCNEKHELAFENHLFQFNRIRTLQVIESQICRYASLKTFPHMENSSIETLIFKGVHLPNFSPGVFKHITTLKTIMLMYVWDFDMENLLKAFDSETESQIENLAIGVRSLKVKPAFKDNVFCNRSIGKSLRKFSIAIPTEIPSMKLFNCLPHLTEFTVLYFQYGKGILDSLGPYLTDYINDFQDPEFQFKNLETINVQKLQYDSESYRTMHISCTPTAISGCKTNPKDHFAPEFRGISSNNQTGRLIEGQYKSCSSNDWVHWDLESGVIEPCFPVPVKYIYFRDNLLPCVPITSVRTSGSLSFYAKTNNLILLDLHNSNLLCQVGWLGDLDVKIYGFQKLLYLDLSSNSLISLPQLRDMISLQTLNISYNRLGLWEGKGWSMDKEFFWNCANLTLIDISYNKLTKIPTLLLTRYPKLHSLLLRGNEIISIQDVMHFHSNSIRLLDLSNNQLSFIEEEIIPNIERYAGKDFQLDLTNSPFFCDCLLKETIEFVLMTKVTLISRDTFTCINRNNTLLLDIDAKSLCKNKPITATAAGVIGGTALVIILTSLIVYKYKLEIKVNFHLFRWRFRDYCHCLKGQTERDLSAKDAFVIYNEGSADDRQFVTGFLRYVVEENLHKSLFIWSRDALPGGPMAESIIEAIHESSKIIIVHSTSLFGIKYTTDRLETNSGLHTTDSVFEIGYSETLVSEDSAGVSYHSQTELINLNVPINENNSIEVVENEWIDFSLLTAMRFIKSKDICVIKRGNIRPKDVARKWHPLLFPNSFFSCVSVIDGNNTQMVRKIEQFMTK